MGLSNAYLVVGADGLMLVDAGAPGFERAVLRRMSALGRDDLRLIFITHAHLDHYGSAAALRRLTGAAIAIHRADGDAMARGETPLGSTRGWGGMVRILMPLIEQVLRPEPTPADVYLDDGDDVQRFGGSGTLLHTPGHTPGSSCLILGDVAFVGDLLSTTGPPRLQRYFASDWSALPKALARLQERQPRRVYTAHGRYPLRGEQLARLR